MWRSRWQSGDRKTGGERETCGSAVLGVVLGSRPLPPGLMFRRYIFSHTRQTQYPDGFWYFFPLAVRCNSHQIYSAPRLAPLRVCDPT